MKKATLMFGSVPLKPNQIHKFRGFVGNVFREHDIVHNHDRETGKNIYRYPLIQFKLIDHVPAIVSITEEAVTLFGEIFMKLTRIEIDGLEIPIHEKDLKIEEVPFGFSDETFMYDLTSPWLGLNQKNYEIYQRAATEESRKDLLRRTLTGNILSMCKSLGHRLNPEETLKTDLRVKEMTVTLKGQKMLGFTGTFKTNFVIPDHLGLGKSVSRGFGMVKKVF
jgi:hypothetical protein